MLSDCATKTLQEEDVIPRKFSESSKPVDRMEDGLTEVLFAKDDQFDYEP